MREIHISLAFLFGCSSIKVHKGFTTQTTCVGNLFWPSVPRFPTQFVKCFCQEFVLRHLLQRPGNFLHSRKFLCFFLFVGNHCTFKWQFLTQAFPQCLLEDFPFPGLSWFKTNPEYSIPHIRWTYLPHFVLIFFVFGYVWILGIVKLVKLCVVNYLLGQHSIYGILG